MPFETPITIKVALERIESRDYVLPAIQREFVWSTAQVERLFDSLMRKYPIGSFLFWKIKAENVDNYRFYSFVRDYHEKTAPHCPRFTPSSRQELTGVLDGQQRLTALNIGVHGSHTTKKPYKHWNNLDAFPTRYLYLNLRRGAPDDDRGMDYDFRFLTEQEASVRDDTQAWYRVRDVLRLEESGEIYRYVKKHGLVDDPDDFPFNTLEKLRDAVCKDGTISFYMEPGEELEKVLDIFVRTNSGGTTLSKSDLLLSTATATWRNRDAREEVRALVHDVNEPQFGFRFHKDFVMKAGLMLSGVSDVGFKLKNFSPSNMQLLEEAWDRIAGALRATVRLAASFGFSAANLTAANALLPIAHYVFLRGFGHDIVDGAKFRDDRRAIRWWLTRSLIKRGIWGVGADTLLTRLRSTVETHWRTGFPSLELADSLTAGSGRLEFTQAEIEDVADSDGGRAFVVLSLLYPTGTVAMQDLHVDHIFPQRAFTKNSMTSAGLAEDAHKEIRAQSNRLANLQLLSSAENRRKSGKMPTEWLQECFDSDRDRSEYCRIHDWGSPDEVPLDLSGFVKFYETRQALIVKRLSELLRQGPDGDAT